MTYKTVALKVQLHRNSQVQFNKTLLLEYPQRLTRLAKTQTFSLQVPENPYKSDELGVTICALAVPQQHNYHCFEVRTNTLTVYLQQKIV